MAIVESPFLSTWASGSVGKCITVRALFQDGKFVMAGFMRYPGRRHQIQDDNAAVFKERVRLVNLAAKL